jgi:hypothetical protein
MEPFLDAKGSICARFAANSVSRTQQGIAAVRMLPLRSYVSVVHRLHRLKPPASRPWLSRLRFASSPLCPGPGYACDTNLDPGQATAKSAELVPPIAYKTLFCARAEPYANTTLRGKETLCVLGGDSAYASICGKGS